MNHQYRTCLEPPRACPTRAGTLGSNCPPPLLGRKQATLEKPLAPSCFEALRPYEWILHSCSTLSCPFYPRSVWPEESSCGIKHVVLPNEVGFKIRVASLELLEHLSVKGVRSQDESGTLISNLTRNPGLIFQSVAHTLRCAHRGCHESNTVRTPTRQYPLYSLHGLVQFLARDPSHLRAVHHHNDASTFSHCVVQELPSNWWLYVGVAKSVGQFDNLIFRLKINCWLEFERSCYDMSVVS